MSSSISYILAGVRKTFHEAPFAIVTGNAGV